VRVEAAPEAFWLRIATGVDRPSQEAEREARIVAALGATGTRVATPLARRDGRGFSAYLDSGDIRRATLLFREAPGAAIEIPAPVHAEALGALVARVHSQAGIAPEGTPRISRAWLADEPLDRIEPWLRRHGHDVAALRRVVDDMDSLARARAPGLWTERALCHGDVHFGNARFDGTGPTLFDFECAGVGPSAYDMACFWRKHVEPEAREPAAAIWDAFLRGYGQVRTIDDGVLDAVPAIAALRALWVMALPAEPHSRWGASWLDDPEYFDAHVGHIRRHAQLADRIASGRGDVTP
jgi:Ser/Thr protein kinase RdoA (MazF antagonist)